MITVFNRKELLITHSLQRHDRVCTLLEEHSIDYQVKVVNRTSPSPFAAGSRAHTGSLGMDQSAVYEYKIFVERSRHEQAQALLRNFN